MEILQFVKLNVTEKKKYFINSRYEIITLDDKLTKMENFNQENFQSVLDRCRVLLKSAREDAIYMEKLKEKNTTLIEEKSAVIEKTKSIIEDLKYDNIRLIERIENLNKEIEHYHQEKTKMTKSLDEVGKKNLENLNLKNEIEKSKINFKKEKNIITIKKDKEINQLWEKVKFTSKFEKDLSQSEKEKYKYKNIANEYKLELQRLNTENTKQHCEIQRLEGTNHSLSKAVHKFESLYRQSRSTISFLVNSEPFKEMKTLYKSLENLNLDDSEMSYI